MDAQVEQVVRRLRRERVQTATSMTTAVGTVLVAILTAFILYFAAIHGG